MQIKETMQRYGYTPTTLAKKMGVFDSTVSRLVTGNPTVQKLQELAEQIGCHRWEFFLDELKAAGFEVVKKDAGSAPSPAPTGVGSGCAQEQPTPSVEQEAGQEQTDQQQGQDMNRPDLITIDPVTGESRKYKLIG